MLLDKHLHIHVHTHAHTHTHTHTHTHLNMHQHISDIHHLINMYSYSFCICLIRNNIVFAPENSMFWFIAARTRNRLELKL